LESSKRIKILKALNEDCYIKKEAGMFTAITSLISAAFSDVFNPNDISGSLMKIVTTATMGYFFGFWWSALTAILQYGFGVDLETILTTINNILSKFISTIFNNNQQDKVNVDKASEQLTEEVLKQSNISGPTLEEPVGNFITAEQQNFIIKEAAGAGLLSKVFSGGLKGFMRSSSGGFIRRIIGTLIKGLLVGAGIGVGTSAVLRGTKPRQYTKEDSDTITQPEKEDVSSERDNSKKRTLKYYAGPFSGQGKTYHLNNANKDGEGNEAWYIENKTGDFGKTIWNWIFTVYPNMNKKAEAILYDNFMRIYNSLKKEFLQYNNQKSLNAFGEYVRIPKTLQGKRIHTIKDIVDLILESLILS
jgi:hypothetical protein